MKVTAGSLFAPASDQSIARSSSKSMCVETRSCKFSGVQCSMRNGGDRWVLVCTSYRPINCETRGMVRILALVQVLRSSTFARNEGDCWVLVCTSKRPINKSSKSVCVETRRMVRSLTFVQVLRCSAAVHNGGDCWVLICNQLREVRVRARVLRPEGW